MQTFTVYPKKGEPFELSCERFEIRESRFILYNSRNDESAEGFLSFARIAAIIPKKQIPLNRGYPDTPIRFYVYLKDRATPIDVFAHAFQTENDTVTFQIQRRDINGTIQEQWPINEIYVAISELIAILPSDGLIWRD